MYIYLYIYIEEVCMHPQTLTPQPQPKRPNLRLDTACIVQHFVCPTQEVCSLPLVGRRLPPKFGVSLLLAPLSTVPQSPRPARCALHHTIIIKIKNIADTVIFMKYN